MQELERRGYDLSTLRFSVEKKVTLMYGVFDADGTRLGSVLRFEGEPPQRRWVAYSVFSDERPGFRTRKEAMAWLKQQKELHDGKEKTG